MQKQGEKWIWRSVIAMREIGKGYIAMREIGKGYAALKTLCVYMNISPPKKYFTLPYKYINQLQNYYSIARRSTANTSVSDLRKAVGAVLYHCSGANNLESRHQFCPLTATSWRKYKVDQVNGPNTYVEKPMLTIPLRIKLRNCSKDVRMETHGTVMNP